MSVCIVSWLTLPAVELNAERVHVDGSFIKWGHSRPDNQDVTPLHLWMASEALSLGVTRTHQSG
jgi:hypothetical protein